MNVLNQYVNYFPKAVAKEGTLDYYGTKRILRDILIEMHTSEENLSHVGTLRALPKEKQRAYKNTMIPCFTVSGYFEENGKGSRKSEDLIYPTKALCLDLDAKQPNADLKALKRQVQDEPFVSYVGDSCRGEGVFAIIHIAEPDKLEFYFEFLSRWLDMNGCLSAFDRSTKNVNRLRFIAPDPDHYINDNTTPLHLPKSLLLPKDKRYNKTTFRFALNMENTAQGTRTKVEQLIHEIQVRKIDIAPDYGTYRNIGFAFANEFREDGRELFHTACSFSNKYNEEDADKQYNNCLKLRHSGNIITIATFFHLCHQAGLHSVQEKQSRPAVVLPISAMETFPTIKKDETEKQMVSAIQPLRDTRSVIFPRSINFSGKENKITHEENWEKEISELQTYFSTAMLPLPSVMLNWHTTIIDTSKFIQSHLTIAHANNGNKTFLPYLERLRELKKLLTINPH